MFIQKAFALLLAVGFTPWACAADHSAIDRFITDDVVAVAYLDLREVDLTAFGDMAIELNLLSPEERKSEADHELQAIAMLNSFLDLGVEKIYVLLRPSDIQHQGVTAVAPVAEGKDPAAVKAMISGFGAAGPPEIHAQFSTLGRYLLAGPNAEQLEMLKNSNGNRSEELAEAWKTLGDGDVGLVVFGSKDSRRVAREMFPKLPKPFDEITGKLVADQLLWGGVKVDLPPEPGLWVHLETANVQTAETVAAACVAGLEQLRDLCNHEPEAKMLLPMLEVLQPTVEGKALTVSFDNTDDNLQRLIALLTPPVEEAREAARRNKRMNQFKRIALAMLNYESANKQLPPAASKSEAGKPLLSWRVHLLPYMEGGKELYKKFHLDEPWDSKHNLSLIQEMPEVYADPDPKLKKLTADGLTTYVVPVGPETVFPPDHQVRYKEITDGTSNTILAVEVPPERAVIWTKPDDWQVELKNPWEALRRAERDYVTVAFCDGSVHVIKEKDRLGEQLPLLLQRADGEVIE